MTLNWIIHGIRILRLPFLDRILLLPRYLRDGYSHSVFGVDGSEKLICASYAFQASNAPARIFDLLTGQPERQISVPDIDSTFDVFWTFLDEPKFALAITGCVPSSPRLRTLTAYNRRAPACIFSIETGHLLVRIPSTVTQVLCVDSSKRVIWFREPRKLYKWTVGDPEAVEFTIPGATLSYIDEVSMFRFGDNMACYCDLREMRCVTFQHAKGAKPKLYSLAGCHSDQLFCVILDEANVPALWMFSLRDISDVRTVCTGRKISTEEFSRHAMLCDWNYSCFLRARGSSIHGPALIMREGAEWKEGVERTDQCETLWKTF